MSLERRLFLLLVGLVLLAFVFLVADRRLPRGHDAFLSYSVGAFGMAHASQGGGLVHWNPCVAQGSEAPGAVPLFPLAGVWPASGRGFAGLDGLALFYFGFFLAELLLLAGTWRLARRHFSDPRTLFFVSAAVVGGSLWIDQPGNVAFVAPFPLIACWIHDAVEKGSRLTLFLAAHLVSLQLAASYAALLLVLVLAIYFAAHALLFPRRWKEGLAGWRPRWTDLAWAAGIASALALPLAALRPSPDAVFASAGRGAEGSVGLDSFLAHGGLLNPLRYLDALAGFSPSLDVTLFGGTITAALAILALFVRPGRDVLHLAAVALLVLLFSAGFLGLVAALAHAGFPGMAYFRHVALAGAFVRFLLALLAGYGFERLLAARPEGDRRIAVASLSVLAVALGVLAFLPRDTLASVLKVLETGHPGFSFRHDLAAGPWAHRIAGAAALAFALLAAALRASRSRSLAPLAALILAANTVHVFGWKLAMLHLKTHRMTPEQQAMQEIGPVPYLPRRTADPAQAPRYAALAPALWPYGTEHGLSEPYFFMDLPVPRGRITSWQRPLDELLRAWSGGAPVASENRLRLPDYPPAIPRVVGLATDKLQVFRRAWAVESPAAFLKDPSFQGDLLFVPGSGPPPADLAGNDRLDAPCEVLAFDANRLVVRTRAPEGAWLAYADVWHPRWRAEVNGEPAAVARANVAYKAVALRAGENRVTFRFEPEPAREVRLRALSAVVVLWWLFIPALAIRAGAGR